MEKICKIFENGDSFGAVLATYDDNTYIERFVCHVLAGEDREERWLQHNSQPILTGSYKGGRIESYSDITDLIWQNKRSTDNDPIHATAGEGEVQNRSNLHDELGQMIWRSSSLENLRLL